MPKRRKAVKLPPAFYIQQREEFAKLGKPPPNPADNTKKSLASVIIKVTK